MLTLCFCKRFRINPDNAKHVRNGVPMCSMFICQKVKEHRERGFKYPHSDPGDECADPYSKSPQARFTDI